MVSQSVSHLYRQFQFESRQAGSPFRVRLGQEEEIKSVIVVLSASLSFYFSHFIMTTVKTVEAIKFSYQEETESLVFVCVTTFNMTGDATLTFIWSHNVTGGEGSVALVGNWSRRTKNLDFKPYPWIVWRK